MHRAPVSGQVFGQAIDGVILEIHAVEQDQIPMQAVMEIIGRAVQEKIRDGLDDRLFHAALA